MLKFSSFAIVAALGLSACSEEDPVPPVEKSREERVNEHMESLRSDATALGTFLFEMPKGGDLHSHTSGAITTEKLIAWGAEDGACVNTTTFVASNPCAAGSVPLSQTESDLALRDAVLSAWSMEDHPGPLLTAHQHFFDAFGKYGAVQNDSRNDDSYADILSRAGRHHQVYVELMQGFGAGRGGSLATPLFTSTDTWDKATLLAKRQQLIALPDFQNALTAQSTSIANTLKGTRTLLGCDTAQPDPGCGVEVRLIVSANRTADRTNVFGQWVYAYELAQKVPEIVGVNLVSPEENANSLAFYQDEMFALGTLDDFNDQEVGRKLVHVSLHAGELIPAVLTAQDQQHMTFHIREAVEKAHAERIGHGADVLAETSGDGAADLLRDMHDAGVMVEICLTSNRVLLGMSGEAHPLAAYLKNNVPVALSTDDSGILRGDITQEYVAAATDQKLEYKTLKQMARASLEHAFAEGDSLWAARDDFSKTVDACASDKPEQTAVSAGCNSFLAANTRAMLQWKLEMQLATFERVIAP
ncbi:amidohydrolase family protein [Corallococcus exiguus]|uniref:adenosine deaminase n=2 Tax=Corallococcus exiguus TaxID=83462 RepID=A0A7X4YBX0_9BACT|nr:adenosine deaminase [Corallococcus exiguus]NBC41839.1 adenosine deaminase [Corallococcus exiguus]TNV58531.1 adenosine deaminase [Corallococcus exiguus]